MSQLPSTCSFYSKVYGKKWSSMRLGLLSPKKFCAVLNTFVDKDDIQRDMLLEQNAIDLAKYYKKHKKHWDILKAKKAEIVQHPELAQEEDLDLLKDRSGLTDYSSADDLVAMFSDRKMDDDEKYFVNKASTQLNLNDFVPSSEIISKENVLTDINYYDFFDPGEPTSCEFVDQDILDFDDQLNIYTFPRNSWERFNQPSQEPVAKLFSYYLLDGASILPVLALNVKMDDVCADYCSAPGGKALSLLMTLKPKYLQCNDVSGSRLAHLKRMMRQFTPDISYVRSTVYITQGRAEMLIEPDKFDKILVDVPCSNDRESLIDLERKIFKKKEFEKKITLPNTQSNILKAALKSLKEDGCLVYSTCTMSPIENDGVVKRVLLDLELERPDLKFTIVNLKEAFRPLRGLFKFYTKFKYGQIVVPNVCSNFGPMYICKIKRIKQS